MKAIVALIAAVFVLTTTASAQFSIGKTKDEIDFERNATRTLFKPYMLPNDSVVAFSKSKVTLVKVIDSSKDFKFKTHNYVFVMKKLKDEDEKGYIARGVLVDVTDSFIVLKCSRYAIDHGSNKPSAAYLKIPWNDIEFMGVQTQQRGLANAGLQMSSAAAGAASTAHSAATSSVTGNHYGYSTIGISGIGDYKTLRMKTEWMLSTVETKQ